MGNETIKTIKGFDSDLKCRDMQYEVGKEYELPEGQESEMCQCGFHAISPDESPLSVFDFYPPSINGKLSRYCEVEIGGKTSKRDSKVVGSHIKIGAEIGIKGLIQAHIEWVKSHITNEHNAEPGKPATAGSYGAATSRGSSSVGKNGLAVARGNGVKVKGDLGAILVIAEENDNYYNIKDWKAVVVDGDTVKADTWYKLVDGKLTEEEG